MALPELKKKAPAVFEQDELPAGFEWVNCLTPRHLRLFVVELDQAIKAAPKDGGESLLQVFDAWKATAAVDADEALRARLLAGRDKKKTYQAWTPERDNPTRSR